jgi:hypothetical protein
MAISRGKNKVKNSADSLLLFLPLCCRKSPFCLGFHQQKRLAKTKFSLIHLLIMEKGYADSDNIIPVCDDGVKVNCAKFAGVLAKI